MATIPEEELFRSIRQLFVNPQYADLTIHSRTTSYQVHRAFVCPRSKFFSAKCLEPLESSPPNNETRSTVASIYLHDDDPHAVEMVVQYLYHLDYPRQPSEPDIPPPVNGYPKDDVPGDEETCESPMIHHTATDEPKPETQSVASQEDRDLQPKSSLVKPPKPSKKKKKRKASTATATLANEAGLPSDSANTEQQAAAEAEAENGQDDAPAAPPAPPSELTIVSEPQNGELVTHAKVFSLSQKYGIEGLRGLALDKFKTQAAEGWDTHDFLAAVREVYHASMDECSDKRMREAVTDIVVQHPELLDKEATQNAIKDLQLNYDVLMRMRKNAVI